MYKPSFAIVVCFLVCWITSCRKYLEAAPDKTMAIPARVNDLKLLLDNYSSLNETYIVASEVLSDNYYVTTEVWSSISDETQRNLYLWQKDDNTITYWNTPYTAILLANTVLDQLPNIKVYPAETDLVRIVRGSALFFRAYHFFSLAQVFAPPYVQSTAPNLPGIPLRLTSDFNEKTTRATLQATYDRMISDVIEAIPLLPALPIDGLKSRPSKPAAYGLLAKIYLSMQRYELAGKYADSCLQFHSDLLNYGDVLEVDPAAAAPIKRFNKEVVFQIRSLQTTLLNPSRAKIDTVLYRSYAEKDKRKQVYFRPNADGSYAFKGDYDGSGSSTGYVFAGIVTDEMYLIRAEAHARSGMAAAAMDDLNTLLEKRWEAGAFSPFTAVDSQDALQLILTERRKELLFRGTRWVDLRRLQNDPLYSVTPQRIINNQVYELLPNSTNYTLQIPMEVVRLTGIPQNE